MSVSTKPPSGFRDFLPDELRRRDYVFGVIQEVFRGFGFDKLETPTCERLDVLTGKYGEEGDQLLFRILQRGNKLTKAIDAGATQDSLAETGLRYDLTVPLARVYAQYRNELPSIFKRYQIAPVWRADRPQRGRYREFYQCDVDIIGSTSLVVEAEVTNALATILKRLKFAGCTIHANHRELLRAVIDVAGVPASDEGTTLVALDKFDKVGVDGVTKELAERGIEDDAAKKLLDFLTNVPDGNDAVLAYMTEFVGDHETGLAAINDLKSYLNIVEKTEVGRIVKIDPFLARGLSYYTGMIFEIRSDDFSGSLGGGGRYDKLIGMFSKQDVPACGFSLGVERIILLMTERDMFERSSSDVDVLITVSSEELTADSVALANRLRVRGITEDVYPEAAKLKKQFKYANERNIDHVIVYGSREAESGVVTLKNMTSGEQLEISVDDVGDRLLP